MDYDFFPSIRVMIYGLLVSIIWVWVAFTFAYWWFDPDNLNLSLVEVINAQFESVGRSLWLMWNTAQHKRIW